MYLFKLIVNKLYSPKLILFEVANKVKNTNIDSNVLFKLNTIISSSNYLNISKK